MKPCTPAACNASICSFGLPATSTGTFTAGQTSCANARYSGSELHRTIRSASVPEYSSASTMSKPAQPKKLKQKLERAPFILTSPRLSSSTFGYRPVACACSLVRRRICFERLRHANLRQRAAGLRRRHFAFRRLLRHVGKIIHAHQRAPSRGIRLLPRRASFRQRLFDRARSQRLGIAAFGLRLLQQRPARARQRIRQRLDVIRPARRSATASRCDSSFRIRCTFNARCASKPKGSTVSWSQPPTAAANASVVTRSRLVYRS